jgi:hypothetical protein
MIRNCGVSNELDCVSDHFPIVTTLEYRTKEPAKVLRRKYKDMDIEIFTHTFQRRLPRCQYIRSRKDLDQVVNEITTAIQKTIEETVPMAVICPRSIPGFTDECKEAINEVKHAQRLWKSRPTDFNRHELQRAKHTRASVISRANRDAYRERVSQVTDEKSLWSLAR